MAKRLESNGPNESFNSCLRFKSETKPFSRLFRPKTVVRTSNYSNDMRRSQKSTATEAKMLSLSANN